MRVYYRTGPRSGVSVGVVAVILVFILISPILLLGWVGLMLLRLSIWIEAKCTTRQ